ESVAANRALVALSLAFLRTEGLGPGGAPAQCEEPGEAKRRKGQRRAPKRPGTGIERRPQQHEVTAALAEEDGDFLVAVARGDPLAHQRAHVAGDVGGGLRDRLVLAHDAADLALERLRARLHRGIGHRRCRERKEDEEAHATLLRASATMLSAPP